MKSPNITNILLSLSLGILLIGIGYKIGQYQSRSSTFAPYTQSLKNDPRAKDLDFELFFDTWQKLELQYVDKSKLDRQKMFNGAIKGMVSSLGDNYTFFLTPDENKETKKSLAGKLEGIGAMLEMKDKNITIISPLKESPAEKAGLKPGDIITKVDGNPTKDWTLQQAVSKIRGAKGTKVQLTIIRGKKEMEFTITRDEFQTNSLDLNFESMPGCEKNCEKVAYLQLYQFGDRTNKEWDDAVEQIEQKWRNNEIKGMVLDVRNNPGGYLDSAIYLASEFLDEGKLVVKQESTTAGNKDYYSVKSGDLRDIPLTVLINKHSASASEIVAGALKDYNKATLVGEKSFGKGSVQIALDLKDGAGLHVTVAKWILPKGQWINGTGIEPNTKVENTFKDDETYSKEKDEQLKKAIEIILR